MAQQKLGMEQLSTSHATQQAEANELRRSAAELVDMRARMADLSQHADKLKQQAEAVDKLRTVRKHTWQ